MLKVHILCLEGLGLGTCFMYERNLALTGYNLELVGDGLCFSTNIVDICKDFNMYVKHTYLFYSSCSKTYLTPSFRCIYNV